MALLCNLVKLVKLKDSWPICEHVYFPLTSCPGTLLHSWKAQLSMFSRLYKMSRWQMALFQWMLQQHIYDNAESLAELGFHVLTMVQQNLDGSRTLHQKKSRHEWPLVLWVSTVCALHQFPCILYWFTCKTHQTWDKGCSSVLPLCWAFKLSVIPSYLLITFDYQPMLTAEQCQLSIERGSWQSRCHYCQVRVLESLLSLKHTSELIWQDAWEWNQCLTTLSHAALLLG